MPHTVSLRPIETELESHIRDKVHRKLREAILKGELQAGERLIERRLAEQLGVSRTPVREALRLLEQEGLVSHLPRVGALVTQVNDMEVYEVYRIREVLEGLAARMAAEKIEAEQLARLFELLRSTEETASHGDLDAMERAHREFNDTIYRAAGSPRLYAMINSLVDCIARYARAGWHFQPGRVAEATREHRRLADAIRLRDGDLAERVAREHINNSRHAYFKRMADRPEEAY
ncbi:MAG: GntR family transcriptional regulator [Thermoanaerobacterales bacterium]|nr:GntR family transcriptional regulator [Bacillota bacterium]MDI6906395.1 GntR family transcriptional regulator [Thermoanaerobacterales bacterium]